MPLEIGVDAYFCKRSIESNFAALKKNREYNEDLSIDQIAKVYK